MRDYLEGYHFTVLSDHLSLKWLDKIYNPSSRLDCRTMELSQWDFEVKYRRGTNNLIADILSRPPHETCSIQKKQIETGTKSNSNRLKTTPPTTQSTPSATDDFTGTLYTLWTSTIMPTMNNGRSAYQDKTKKWY